MNRENYALGDGDGDEESLGTYKLLTGILHETIVNTVDNKAMTTDKYSIGPGRMICTIL